MKKITWKQFSAALIKNNINPEGTPNYWRDQLHKWNCGNRGDMNDKALSMLVNI